MIRFVSRATLFLALGLLVASVATAGVPNAASSTINAAPLGNGILLGGHNAAGTATGTHPGYNPYFPKTITVKDASNTPVANSVVVLNFNACYGANGLRLGSVQPGLTVNAGARSVSGVTNASGVVVLKICGGGNHTVGNSDPDAPAGCIAVTADGVPLGTLNARYFDQNGLDCLNIADFGLFANDYTANCPAGTCYRLRSDYNFNGPRPVPLVNNDVSDFGIFSNAYTQADFGGNNCANGGSTSPMVP